MWRTERDCDGTHAFCFPFTNRLVILGDPEGESGKLQSAGSFTSGLRILHHLGGGGGGPRKPQPTEAPPTHSRKLFLSKKNEIYRRAIKMESAFQVRKHISGLRRTHPPGGGGVRH